MAKILVTGGAGFIGSHLVDALVEKGHNVCIIDNLSTGLEENINPEAKFFIRDVNDDISDIFEKNKFDYVFHLAAQMNVRKSIKEPREDARINISGGLNVIENCIKHKVKKFIFSSTGGAMYASKAELPCTEESLKEPETPYGIAKLTIENYLRVMKNVHGLDFTCLRYANVYGPRQNAKGEAGVVAIFIENLMKNMPVTIFGDGHQTRDFVYVADVVKANLMAMNISGTFNVSTGHETSINEITEKIIKYMDKDGKIVRGNAIAGELIRNFLSNEKIKKQGYALDYDLEKGLLETINWFKKKGVR